MLIRNLYHFFINYIKRPIFYRFFVLRWEIFRKSPVYFKYYGYKVFYLPKDGLVYHIGSEGCFEPEVIDICYKSLPINGVFIDVGASIGLITLALARLRPKATFHCFEPSPYPFSYFRKTINKNRLNHRIKLNQIGLYQKPGKLKFYLHHFKDSSGDGLKDTHRAGETRPITIRVTTLDKYIHENKLKKVDLLKIDIEGAELYVLKGAIRTIRRFVPKIIFEAWPENLKAYGLNVCDLYNFFKKIDYYIYNMKGELLDEKAFIKSTEKEANYLACSCHEEY